MKRDRESKDRHPARTGRPTRRSIPKVLLAVVLVVAAVLVAAVVFLWPDLTGRSRYRGLGDLVEPGAAAGFNVLLVTFDTTRWDHLGCYGRQQAATPSCDRLAARGVRFEHAVASAPLTLPSHATILTGLYPGAHGARDNGRYLVGAEHETLAETFGAHGYDTAAFVACFVLDARFGLDQGFDVYDFQVTQEGFRPQMPDYNERPADAVTDAAIAWLRERETRDPANPFFLWVHYFDPHLPYTSPSVNLPRFAGLPYDAEIAFADQEFGRLLRELASLGQTERTLVVLTSDHGEALGEHGEKTHGMLVYDCTIRVPLIFSCPVLFDRPFHITEQVAGLVDLRRTLEDLTGIPAAAASDGRSLLDRKLDPTRAIYFETEGPLNLCGWSPLSGLRRLDRKYIHGPSPEFYDLRQDPRELRDLYRERPDGQAELVAELAALSARWTGAGGTSRQLSDEEIERLASLGYVQAGGPAGAGELADPKQMMPVLRDAQAAERLQGEGKYDEAADLARSVLDRSPGCIQARRVLALCLLRLDRGEEAVAVLEEALAAEDPFLIRSLAQVLILEQRLDEAEQILDLYARVAPDDGRHHLLRGDIRYRFKRFAEALACYEQAARVDENRTGIRARQRSEKTRQVMAAAGEGGSD